MEHFQWLRKNVYHQKIVHQSVLSAVLGYWSPLEGRIGVNGQNSPTFYSIMTQPISDVKLKKDICRIFVEKP